MKYYMHVNYLERLFDIPEITKRCADAGFDGIELRGVDRTGELSLEAYLAKACDAAEAAKLDLVLGCPNQAMHADENVRNQSLDKLKTTIQIAGDRGAKIFNVFAGPLLNPDVPYTHFEENGSALATDEHYQRAATYFQEAGDAAAKYDMSLCFEMHNGYLHDLAKPTAKLLTMIGKPNVRANFDMGNITLNRNALPLDECINVIGPHIGYIHLKNMILFNRFDSRLFRGTALDEGDIDHYTLIRKLLDAGYRGPWTIENVMPGDKRPLMTRDLTYLKSIVKELAAE